MKAIQIRAMASDSRYTAPQADGAWLVPTIQWAVLFVSSILLCSLHLHGDDATSTSYVPPGAVAYRDKTSSEIVGIVVPTAQAGFDPPVAIPKSAKRHFVYGELDASTQLAFTE